MTGDNDASEEDTGAMDLDAALRALIARVDPVPPEVERYAVAAFAFREADVAELEWDSWSDAEALTRGPSGTRMLVFASAGVRIHIGVTRTASGFDLDGYVEPAGPSEVEIQHHDGVLRRPIDRTGRFDADLPAVPSIRLHLRGTDSPPTVTITGWVALG